MKGLSGCVLLSTVVLRLTRDYRLACSFNTQIKPIYIFISPLGQPLMNKSFLKLKHIAIILTGFCANSIPAMANADWTIKGLGTLGGSSSEATGINNSGQVVGVAGAHPFITGANGMGITSLGNTGSTGEATGINDSGQVVGWTSSAGSTARHAFITGANGAGITSLGSENGGDTFAIAINNSGQVVGWYAENNGARKAYITGPDGAGMTSLDTPGATNRSIFPLAINAAGQVAGFTWINGGADEQAFITGTNGKGMMMLETLGTQPYSYSYALDINNSGQVVGASSTSDGAQAFITGSDGNGMASLGTFGGTESEAAGINNTGQVVGWADTVSSTDALLYSDGVLTDLSLLAPVVSAGWSDLRATAINDKAQIAGYGILNGAEQAFLLSPVPEPETYVMLLAGLVLLGLMSYRREII